MGSANAWWIVEAGIGNFIAKNNDGVTVNRWITTGFLAASATTNETAFATYKVVRSAGMLVFDNQARV
jgi:formate dehydrogenase major subunit